MWRHPLWLVVVVACGGDASPAEKCDDLVDLVCDRAVECLPPGSGTHSECTAAIKAELPCGRATMIAPSYPRCVDQLEDNSCAVLFPNDSMGNPTLLLPADCSEVILIERTVRTEMDRWEPVSSDALASPF